LADLCFVLIVLGSIDGTIATTQCFETGGFAEIWWGLVHAETHA
jgi:hypothetical protein